MVLPVSMWYLKPFPVRFQPLRTSLQVIKTKGNFSDTMYTAIQGKQTKHIRPPKAAITMEKMTHKEKNQELGILENVLDTFFSIDEKIMELHTCSSDDFLSLNRTLKENHHKARYINEHISLAFDKMGEEGNLKNISLLKGSLSKLQSEIFSLEDEMNKNLSLLEKIQSNFSLMFVPINNFRQNLAALRLLLSNIKITNTLFDKSLKDFSNEEAAKIEAVISKVKDSCPIFEENIYNIQKHLKSLYKELNQLKELVFIDALKKLESLQLDFDIVEKHNKATLKNREGIDELAKNCTSSVGSIITNLQYHDIIRQKMEHIQQTHQLIIKELNEGGQNESSEFTTNPFFLQIPQIIEIQTAQLLHTNKEYQNAIDHISKKMIDIGQDMTAIARIYKSVSLYEFKGRDVSKEKISTSFHQLIDNKKECLDKFYQLADDVILVHKIVGELFEKFQDLEMMENTIEQRIIDKISFSNLLVSEEHETASQAQQILKLYADNHFEKSKIKTLFDHINVQLKEFIKSNAVYVHDHRGPEKINQVLNTAVENFEAIGSNFDFLENIQHEVTVKSQEIAKASKDVVGNVKYYDFFENTIEELLLKFEDINQSVKVHSKEVFSAEEKAKGLEQIEKYYTMKSERIIHNQSLVSQDVINKLHNEENESNTDPDREGNDVEFF